MKKATRRKRTGHNTCLACQTQIEYLRPIMDTTTEPELMVKTWNWLTAEPVFESIPYRFEVKPDGKIIMSPTKNYHGRFQFLVASLLQKHGPDGKAFVELSTKTPDGMYEVDCGWSHDGDRLLKQDYADPAADICVEIRSPSNTSSEFREKRTAYFGAGAKEVWFVDVQGNISFYGYSSADGQIITGISGEGKVLTRGAAWSQLERSQIMPDFPSKVEL